MVEDKTYIGMPLRLVAGRLVDDSVAYLTFAVIREASRSADA
jgi:hypothetical protein